MKVSAGWMQQRQSGIGFNELSSMVSELIANFERQSTVQLSQDAPWSPDWVSPSSRTRVIRHGSSAALHSVLMQTPDTVSAEYEVLHRGLRVFTWCEYLWPQHQRERQELHSGKHYLPQDCLDELMDFHVRNHTHWLACFRRKLRTDRAIEIDKVGVVTQANCIELC